jgi:hypothetical protein
MSMNKTLVPSKAAIVICPRDADPTQRILGLSVGERLLLALSYSGIEEVCFVGPGKRPTSDRADLRYIQTAEIDPAKNYIVLASDTVFDRGLLRGDTFPLDLALTHKPGHSLSWMADLDGVLEDLGQGQADSGRSFAIRVDSRLVGQALVLITLVPVRDQPRHADGDEHEREAGESEAEHVPERCGQRGSSAATCVARTSQDEADAT